MLEVVDLQLKYGSNIGALNFKLASGTLTWLKGANGAGKSTLLLTLMGFETAREGRIIWDGDTQSFAYAQQKPDFAFGLTVERVLELARVDCKGDVASRLGMGSLLKTSVTKLSGGEAQRVLLTIAFSNSAKYLLLDEPFASQDVQFIEQIKLIIKEQLEIGKAILVASHIAVEADQVIELI